MRFENAGSNFKNIKLKVFYQMSKIKKISVKGRYWFFITDRARN